MPQVIHWLVQSREASLVGGPAESVPAWLSDAEQGDLRRLQRPKRKQDWLLGRWTAKQLVRSVLDRGSGRPPRLRDLDVRQGDDGAPQIRMNGVALPVSLSISHSGAHSLCAACELPGAQVGADLEAVAPREAGFVQDYFTPEERARVGRATGAERDRLVTAVWSAKEAVLKALHLGLTVDTRRVCCVPGPGPAAAEGWTPLHVRVDPALLDRSDRVLRCWWRRAPGAVMTLAVLL